MSPCLLDALLYIAENGCKWRRLPKEFGKSRGGWNTKIHMVAADDGTAVTFSLSPGQASDSIEGRALLESWQDKLGALPKKLPMDRACGGDETRDAVSKASLSPAVPAGTNCKQSWGGDKEIYKHRNEVERLFRKPKGVRRIFTRFEKRGVMFTAFLLPVLHLPS